MGADLEQYAKLYARDNFWRGCPAKMSDGRLFTDHRPRGRVEHDMQTALGIPPQNDFRLYLQMNGERLRSNGQRHLRNYAGCHGVQGVSGIPHRHAITCDAFTCSRSEIDPDGLGDRRVVHVTPKSQSIWETLFG